MNALRIPLAALALALLAFLPAGAGAASLVPPGNSAANQYTETFPTTGGNAEAEGKGKGKGKATPGDVLGAGNAEKLDSKGKQGRETAAVVAATAPPPVTGSVAGEGSGGDDSGAAGGGSAGGGPGGGQAAGGGSAGGGDGSGPATSEAKLAGAEGSSGVGEVLGQATGSSSSGGIGLLLPLIVLGSVIWALAFFLRRRRRTA